MNCRRGKVSQKGKYYGRDELDTHVEKWAARSRM
jgi:hypothetical protein